MLGLNDKEMIEKLHKYMCFGNKVYKRNKQYSIKYRNEESIDFLIKNGLIQRKSLEINFPILPIEFMPSFIRGYFDGDGSISLRIESDKIYGRVAFTSGSINFLRGLQNCLYYNFNIMSHIYDGGHKDTKTMALVITRRSEIDKLYNMMYDDTDFYLYRKYNKFVELSKYKPKHKFKCMIQSELIGNYKRYGIKSLYDNKLFMNPDRQTTPDIDSDYYADDRETS